MWSQRYSLLLGTGDQRRESVRVRQSTEQRSSARHQRDTDGYSRCE